MKRVLLAVAVVAIAGPAVAQSGAPFCVVSGAGHDCHYYSLSSCQRAASSMSGACVANAAPPPRASSAPAPLQWGDGGRITADVAGRFTDGFERAQQQRFDREARDLDLERQRIENERLRASLPPAAGKEGEPPPVDSWAVLSEIMLLLRQMPAQNTLLLRAVPEGVLTQADIDRCEAIRVGINTTRANRTAADLARLSSADELEEEAPYTRCLYRI